MKPIIFLCNNKQKKRSDLGEKKRSDLGENELSFMELWMKK